MTDTQHPFQFAVTWDYRCPFARNAHEHVIAALEAGAPFEVDFVPFSLNQMHLEEGDPPVWDNPAKAQDLLAIEVGLVVRDRFPGQFLAVHRALFALRHDEGGDLREEASLRAVLEREGADADYVFAEIESGWPLDTFRKEHDAAERDHSVWGVPTFLVGDQAAFVRLMTRPAGDGALARRTIERLLTLFGDEGLPELNEFKHTSIPR
ncbi:MAG: DsbA family protein [Acidimicrobiales bacterium]